MTGPTSTDRRPDARAPGGGPVPPTRPSPPDAGAASRKRLLEIVMTLGLLGAGAAFVLKIFSFIFTLESEEAAGFAAVPVSTYFAVAGGYLCLGLWALARGHFRDLEAPKHRMLELEALHDRQEVS